MTKLFTTLMVCAAAALPVSALAQSDDGSYCSKLATTYQRYVGDNASAHRSQQRDAGVDTAISGCATNASASIPVIEQALRNAKVDLPAR